MLRLKIASALNLTLENARVPEVAVAPSLILQDWNETKPPQPWQITSLSDDLICRMQNSWPQFPFEV
jgi:hypothetical protein